MVSGVWSLFTVTRRLADTDGEMALCVLGAAPAGVVPALPLQKGSLPRLLGPQHLGPLQRAGQDPGSAR